jgi:hypothetical protein
LSLSSSLPQETVSLQERAISNSANDADSAASTNLNKVSQDAPVIARNEAISPQDNPVIARNEAISPSPDSATNLNKVPNLVKVETTTATATTAETEAAKEAAEKKRLAQEAEQQQRINEQFAEASKTADNLFAYATKTTDPDRRASAKKNALAAVATALTVYPDNTDMKTLKQQIEAL